ncbi:MAG: hypothetical protein ACTSRG_11400 [Candidatus Helarchaeota archaeon]
MKKKNIGVIIILALITLGFIFGIWSVIDREKGYPPGLELGTNLSYWYDSLIFGNQVPSTTIHGELYTIVGGYNPLLRQIELLTLNNWYNGSQHHVKQEVVSISELVPTFPLRSVRNSSIGGINGQVSGEFFGWILPRDYPSGIAINNYFLEKTELKSTAAGTFSTNVFTKANITKENDISISELTRLYYEQWSGVMVYGEHIFSVVNSTSGEIMFFEYEYTFLTTISNYKWPLVTLMMPVLSFSKPVTDFFSTYALFILVILLAVAIIVLWKKSSIYS